MIGTLDTKGEEFAFLLEQLKAGGLQTVMIDTGIMANPVWAADIAAEEVARRGGSDLATLRSNGNRAAAVAVMARGAQAIVGEMFDAGRIGGGICLGGGQGSTIGAGALQVLPVGVPKIMVSTIAGVDGASASIVGIRDMTLVNSVVDISGLNSLSRPIIANAACAQDARCR